MESPNLWNYQIYPKTAADKLKLYFSVTISITFLSKNSRGEYFDFLPNGYQVNLDETRS